MTEGQQEYESRRNLENLSKEELNQIQYNLDSKKNPY